MAAFALLYPLCAYYLGRLLRTMAGVESRLAASFAFNFLSGYLMLGVVQFASHTFYERPLIWQFLLILTAAALGQFLLPKATAKQDAAEDWVEAYVTGFCLLAATLWARGLLHSVELQGDEWIFHNWMDFFSHASMIARLNLGVNLWTLGHVELSGLPTSFVHYASYMGPATQVAFRSQPAYAAGLDYWTPMGTFLTGLAAYVMVFPWAGRVGGLAAAAALLTLPDPSYLWAGNGYLGYHWLQQIGVAGMYGTACGALALTFLLQWRRQRSRSAFVLAACFAVATFTYKGQFGFVLVPLFGACLTLWLPNVPRSGRVILFLSFVAACVAGGLLLNRLYPEAHPFGLNRAYFENYNRSLANEVKEPHCQELLQADCANLGTARYYAISICLCALSTFGPWLVIGGSVLSVLMLRRQVSTADAVPWLAVAIYLTLYATFNDHSLVGIHMWELIHRPFVWAYFLLCIWSAARFCQLAGENAWGRRMLTPGVLALLCLPLMALPYRMGRCVQEGKSICRFDCVNVRVPRGLVESACFLARNAAPLDVVQDSHCDKMLIVGGFAQRRSYMARPEVWSLDKSPLLRDEIQKRKSLVEQIKHLTDDRELYRIASDVGIRWFILHPNDAVSWPSSIVEAPSFASQGFRVYDLTGQRRVEGGGGTFSREIR
jgi:hypothetical protein